MRLAGFTCWMPGVSYDPEFWVDEGAVSSYRNWSFRGVI
jgi:hypothetical protein